MPLKIAGAASTSNTFLIINEFDAPQAKAASITPGSISASAISTSLAKNTVAVIAKGTEAAIGPILVPTKKKVKGRVNTTKIIKGIDLTKLTADPTHLFTSGLL